MNPGDAKPSPAEPLDYRQSVLDRLADVGRRIVDEYDWRIDGLRAAYKRIGAGCGTVRILAELIRDIPDGPEAERLALLFIEARAKLGFDDLPYLDLDPFATVEGATTG